MNPVRKSYLALFLGAVIIAFSPILIKMSGAPGIVSSFYRMAIGSLILVIPFGYSRLKSSRPIPLKGLVIAVLAGFCFATDMAFWSTGIMATNATIPTLAGNMAPLWVGLGAMFLFKERQKRSFWAGLFMALSGVVLLVIRDLYFPEGMLKGLLFGLTAGMFYAAFQLLAQPGRKYFDTLTFLFITTLTTAIFLGGYLLLFHLNFTGYSNSTWVIFIIMGLVIQAGAWFLINYAQGYLSASIVSPTLLGQPVIAAILAFFLLGERLTYWHILGGIVVVTGIYTIHFSTIKKKMSKQ